MSSNDRGYVHEPSTFDEESEGRRSASDERTDSTADWVGDPIHPEATDRAFDWRGWVLVAVVVFAFVVSPVAIVVIPPDVSYLFALIILPLFPAVVLATTAVWATTRP